MINRRTFIKTTAAAGAAVAFLPSRLSAFYKSSTIGIQLYTIRDLVQQDLPGTLKVLADIGFKSIEAAGYNEGKFYGYTPSDFKKLVEENGLIALSSHSGVNTENVHQHCQDALEAGMKYLVVPSLDGKYRKSPDGYKLAAEDFNKIGEICNGYGVTFGYHNHAFEFELLEGEVPYDILLNNTMAELVTMQLDTYWMVYGGFQPAAYFKKYPGRFKLWHVKDMDSTSDRESTEIGSGVIDFIALFEMADEAGLENYFVEQEAFKMDPIRSLTKSVNYLKTI